MNIDQNSDFADTRPPGFLNRAMHGAQAVLGILWGTAAFVAPITLRDRKDADMADTRAC